MKATDTLAREAKAILEDEDHVLWHALAQHKENLTADMLAQNSEAALAPYWRQIRGLDAPKEALRALANAGHPMRHKKEA